MQNRDETIIRVAILYYEEEMTQTQIAKTLNISRPTVATMLQEAKDKGIVKISIQHSSSHLHELEQALATKYNIDTVLIAPSNNKAGVGQLCADFISDRLPHIESLGIGWGSTVYEYVSAAQFENLNHLSLIPLMGGVGINDVRYHSNHLVFTLSTKYNCEVNYFYAPAVAESIEVRDMLVQTKMIDDILLKGQAVDAAVVSVGNPIKSSTYRYFGLIEDEDADEIYSSGAIGDLLATFFDENAHPVFNSISERMIGLTIEQLSKIKDVIVLATGHEKVSSIRVLLENNIANHIIIDQTIAKELLK